MFWHAVPTELRHEILFHLADAASCDGETLVGYATVATEWQPVFEQRTFMNLHLKSSEIDDFNAIFQVERRRKSLRQIGLVLELPKHKPVPLRVVAGTTEDHALAQMMIMARRGAGAHHHFPALELQQKQNDVAFTEALQTLFLQLESWNREQCHPGGVGLEIVADSKSYWQDAAAKIRQRAGPLMLHTEILPRRRDGRQRFQPLDIAPSSWDKSLSAGELDFHFSLNLDFGHSASPTLSRVQVITGLFILRRSIRHFDPRAVSLIMENLPALKTFVWEIGPRAHWKTKHRFDDDLSQVVSNWPSSLDEVRITQRQPFGRSGHPRPSPYLAPLASSLSCLCQFLKYLSIEYSIDAFQFFAASPLHYPNLQGLFLRSEEMILDEVTHPNNVLLTRAADAVRQMSKLRSFALYSINSSHAGCFSYEHVEGMPILALRCSWPFEISQDCEKSWDAVVRHLRSRRGRWCVERLPVERVRMSISTILARNSSVSRC